MWFTNAADALAAGCTLCSSKHGSSGCWTHKPTSDTLGCYTIQGCCCPHSACVWSSMRVEQLLMPDQAVQAHDVRRLTSVHHCRKQQHLRAHRHTYSTSTGGQLCCIGRQQVLMLTDQHQRVSICCCNTHWTCWGATPVPTPASIWVVVLLLLVKAPQWRQTPSVRCLHASDGPLLPRCCSAAHHAGADAPCRLLAPCRSALEYWECLTASLQPDCTHHCLSASSMEFRHRNCDCWGQMGVWKTRGRRKT